MEDMAAYEHELTASLLNQLATQFPERIRVIGPTTMEMRGGVVSFDVEGVHPHDVAQVLDQFGVCVRPGHHCAKPLMKRFSLAATARASFGPYSNESDIEMLMTALDDAVRLFG
jgi:cysteine desulfurase/selenocysteine lyase